MGRALAIRPKELATCDLQRRSRTPTTLPIQDTLSTVGKVAALSNASRFYFRAPRTQAEQADSFPIRRVPALQSQTWPRSIQMGATLTIGIAVGRRTNDRSALDFL